MNILVSSYNCSPLKGSEEKLGWSTIIEYAKKGHNVYTITDISYQDEIQEYIASNIDSCPYLRKIDFTYVKVPKALKKLKGHIGQIIRYRFFQNKIGKGRFYPEITFDFCHHVSWASIVQPIGLSKKRIPLIVGPVGGGEVTPAGMWGGYSYKEKIIEYIRRLNAKSAYLRPGFWRICNKSIAIFVTTWDTASLIPRKYHDKIRISQAVTLDENEIVLKNNCKSREEGEPFRIIMSGRLIYWKAFELGIKAAVRALDNGYNIIMDIYGTGRCLPKLESIAGIYNGKEINFRGRIDRDELLNAYGEYDVLVNCSLHDSGCLTVLEAMSQAVPVICVNTGGPGVLTDDNSAIRIEPDNPQKVEDGIYTAIDNLYKNPSLCYRMGQYARQRVINNFMTHIKIEKILDEICLYKSQFYGE